MSIQEKRRADFEAYMESKLPANLAWHERDEHGYLLKFTQAAWDIWNAALDSVVVTLPQPVEPDDPEDAIDDSWMDGYNGQKRMHSACIAAIESAGLKVAP